MQKFLVYIAGLFFLLEFYVYQAIKAITANNFMRMGYIALTVAIYGFMIYEILHFKRSDRDHHRVQIIVSIFMIFFLPKLIIAIFLLIDDISRFIQFLYQHFTAHDDHYPGRRKFLSVAGIGLAGIFSLIVVDGIIKGKYRYQVRRVKIKIKNLPKAFKGYKIVQISDVHSGSFFHPKKLQHAIDLINEQNADLVLFTGDMVNAHADEFKPFVELFSTIKSKDGKFAVLGNHDYGDYAEWNSPMEHAQNVPNLIEHEKKAGFRMLRNEHVAIEKNGEKLYIIGVENWGEKPFPQYGDLDKAVDGIPENGAKILMSHDPTHFDKIVKFHPSDISLTLSGHTHGMQFGIDLKNFRWSPVEYRYPKWADLYESNGRYLYVNRGFGIIAFPGRVGIDPEITVFELE